MTTQPAISYNVGRLITVDFADRQARAVTIQGKVSGIYLEPGAPTAQAEPARRGGGSRRPAIPQRRRPD